MTQSISNQVYVHITNLGLAFHCLLNINSLTFEFQLWNPINLICNCLTQGSKFQYELRLVRLLPRACLSTCASNWNRVLGFSLWNQVLCVYNCQKSVLYGFVSFGWHFCLSVLVRLLRGEVVDGSLFLLKFPLIWINKKIARKRLTVDFLGEKGELNLEKEVRN